ncbi:MAG: hypothetical protein ACYTGB_03375 [Planctomycetota bacterium]|jgi:prepilin-type processing-associated H-X9-DG protein
MHSTAPGGIASGSKGRRDRPVLARGKRKLDAGEENLVLLAPGDPPRRKRHLTLAEAMVILLLLFLLGGLATPPLQFRSRAPARRAYCKSNVRQLALACMIYAEDNNGAFPQKLAQLYPTYIDNAKVFSCPSCPSTYRDFQSGAVTAASSSYVLVPGMRDDMRAQFILIHEKATANHGGDGGNVGFVDGHVEWHRTGAFEQNIKAQGAALKKWRAAGSKPADLNDAPNPCLDAPEGEGR